MEKALAHATETFTETLERKWANEEKNRPGSFGKNDVVIPIEQGKTEDVVSAQPQDTTNTYGGAELEPVVASKHGDCRLCMEQVNPGDSIVTDDGLEWVHTSCAMFAGWAVA